MKRLRLSLTAWQKLVVSVNPRRSRLNWRTRELYWLSSATHSLLTQFQHASHADAIKAAVPPPPIFLLGFWRSGTTFLHELFCRDPRFGFPSTYACLNPSHFLLSEPWVRGQMAQRQTPRPMDNLRYSWTSPQEDEFALLALGAPSPYEALLVPSLMREPRSLLDLRERPVKEQDRWKQALVDFLRLLTVQQGKTMVLKSPPHGFRLPLLPALFPQARYVIIERNPYEVFVSNLKLWRTLLDMYSLESYSLAEIEAFVLAAYLIHEESIAEGVRNISPRALARVRYEDLVADPIGQMVRLYMELGIEGFEAVRPILSQHVADIGDYKRNHFLLSPLQKSRLDEEWGEVIRGKGYICSNNYVSLTSPPQSVQN
jgi:hypothetical protein